MIGAWPSISHFGLGFLTTAVWGPRAEQFGGLVMIWGTVATSPIALLIAVPVSFGIALFLTELSPSWLRRPSGIAVELLAAVPSIVYGMGAHGVWSALPAGCSNRCRTSWAPSLPWAHCSRGPGGLGIRAGIILAIMIPFRRLGDARCVRRDAGPAEGIGLRPGLHHLGGGLESRAALHQDGVVGGVMLGLGRALGETMAVTGRHQQPNQLNSLSLCSRPKPSDHRPWPINFTEAGANLHQASRCTSP